MRKFKRILSAVLAVGMLTLITPVSVFAVEDVAAPTPTETPNVASGNAYSIAPLAAIATDVDIDGIKYNLNDDGTATVAQNSGASGNIEIPSKVNYNSIDYMVTSIGDGAFRDCPELTSISIPDSVTLIGNAAFTRCSGLTSIAIPSGLSSISTETFLGCSGLISVIIPANIISIGNDAFTNCNGLIDITISDGVTSIGNNAFRNCTSLTNITIPDSVNSIGAGAFANIQDCTFNMPATAPALVGGSDHFGLNPTIYVPQGATGYDANGWENYADYISVVVLCPYNVIGGTYGVDYEYDSVNKKLILNSGTLTVEGDLDPETSEAAGIEVAPNSTLNLTIKQISPASDTIPGLKIGTNAVVNLTLEGDNVFCRGWDDIHTYSVYLDANAKVTADGSGTLTCNRNYAYPKLYLADTAELIVNGGTMSFSGGQNENSNKNPYTVGGSGKLTVNGGNVKLLDELRGIVFQNNPQIEVKSGVLELGYYGTLGSCRMTMSGGTLKATDGRGYSFNSMQYNGGTIDFAPGRVTFDGQTAINADLFIPDNNTYIVSNGSTMTFAKGTTLTKGTNSAFTNLGTVIYYCHDTTIPEITGGTTQAVHTYGGWSFDETGHWHECIVDNCPDVEGSKIDYTEHDFGDWEITLEPTETEKGLRKHTCEDCGYEEEQEMDTLAHEHVYGGWVYDENGHWHECTSDICPDVESSKIDYAEHDFGEWEITLEPTETEKGLRKHSCETCGYEEEQEMDTLEHEHIYGDWVYDETGHWRECTSDICPDENKGKTDYAPHEWDDDADTDCNICGYTRTVETEPEEPEPEEPEPEPEEPEPEETEPPMSFRPVETEPKLGAYIIIETKPPVTSDIALGAGVEDEAQTKNSVGIIAAVSAALTALSAAFALKKKKEN